MKKNEYEYVEGKEVDLNEIEIENDFLQPDRIKRIVFRTNLGIITYRPSAIVEEVREEQGFRVKTRQKELITINQLPNKIRDLNDVLREKCHQRY